MATDPDKDAGASAPTAASADASAGPTAAQSAASWLDEHGDYLYSYARSRGADTHLAEDLVQDTLLAAMQAQRRFEHASSVRTWLTSILRHKLIDNLRRESARHPTAAGEDELERFVDSQFHRRGKWRVLPGRWGGVGSSVGGGVTGVSDDPTTSAECEELRRALAYCMEKLPPRPAEVIDLSERGGLNLEQISKVLGVTTTNAGVLLHRARLALRRCLELKWFRSGGRP
jgi:RNA polymerase sigma-70 factor, ECF subfamily